MRSEKSKRVLSLLVGALASATFAGANLQTFVLGATEITMVTESLEAGNEYSISSIEGFLRFRDLVNAGRVHSEARVVLVKDLDLTEGEEYTHGYCDNPVRGREGNVIGWHRMERGPRGEISWEEGKLDIGGDAIKITNDIRWLEGGREYVIDSAESLARFVELGHGSSDCTEAGGAIKVVLLGDMVAGEFVEPALDVEGDPVSWLEANGIVLNDNGSFQNVLDVDELLNEANWARVGAGGGVYGPVGTKGKQFLAKFDGRNHRIRLTAACAASSETACAGIFGCVGESGKIAHLKVADGSYIDMLGKGRGCVGGIAGELNGGEIIGCQNYGEINADCASGGIVGRVNGGRIFRSKNNGRICAESGVESVGGIAGELAGGTITRCENYGMVSGGCLTLYVGGVVGNVDGGIVTESYNGGEIGASFDKANLGGVAGFVFKGEIKYSCNEGKIVAGAESIKAGGIAGTMKQGSAVCCCYNTGEISAHPNNSNVGGIVGNIDHGLIGGCYVAGKMEANSAGSIAGSAVCIRVVECYCLESTGRSPLGNMEEATGAEVVAIRCEQKTMEEMQTEDFADKLNVAQADVREHKDEMRKLIEAMEGLEIVPEAGGIGAGRMDDGFKDADEEGAPSRLTMLARGV